MMTKDTSAALAITMVVQDELVLHRPVMMGVPATMGTVDRRTKMRPTRAGTGVRTIRIATKSGV